MIADQSLERMIVEGGPLPAVTAVDLVQKTLTEARARGISPAELTLGSIFVALADNGLPTVEIVRSDPLAEGSRGNSAPPEDERAGVRAVGAILERLVLGVTASGGVPEDANTGLGALLARCFEDDPTRHFATVDELERELASYASRAAPDAPRAAIAKTIATRALAAALLVILVGMVASLDGGLDGGCSPVPPAGATTAIAAVTPVPPAPRPTPVIPRDPVVVAVPKARRLAGAIPLSSAAPARPPSEKRSVPSGTR
jgi:hypothetical protein